ncbi:hypothetical protein NKH77_46875 [Streptomyces sp. M19]
MRHAPPVPGRSRPVSRRGSPGCGWLGERARLRPGGPRRDGHRGSGGGRLRDLGCVVEHAAPDGLEDIDATELSAVLFAGEIVPYFREAVGGRAAELGAVLRRALAAPRAEAADHVAAQQRVELLSGVFAGYFERYDALLCPVCPIPPRRTPGAASRSTV